MSWVVYDKTGQTSKCEIHKLEYNGTWMGECFVTADITSAEPIDFAIGDYLEYRGERFEINYDPSVVKKAKKNSTGDAFTYEGVKFNSLSDELVRCDFRDYVPVDNQIHYTSLSKFSFFAPDVTALAERIQANLDRIYTGSKKWTVSVHPEFSGRTDVNINVDNITVWDALALANSKFDANFIIRGRVITIGTAGIAAGNIFKYGKGNGLYEMERTADAEQKLITRLHVYGSTRNLPKRYYNSLVGESGASILPDNMAVDNLMLPGFPEETLDPYIDSDNIEELGIREGSVYFDGSNEDLPEVFPSIEGMTAEELEEAGIPVASTGNLDEIVSAEQITDNGEPDDEGEIEKSTFTVTLKDIGFDINDYLTEEAATLSMKSGMCAGREFEITSCEKQGNNYVIECNRVYDETLKLFFPYNGYNLASGNKFVLLYIDLPDVYIRAASQRLKTKGEEYLSKNDYVRYSYTPKVDDIYMAKQHDLAISTGATSLHDTLKEGDIFLFDDTDLGISGSVTIDSLTIREGESMIPQYEVVLRDEKTVGAMERIQNQIDSIANGQGGGGGYNAQQIQSLIRAYGTKMFLSKIMPDQTSYLLKLLGGAEFGTYSEGVSGGKVDAQGAAELLSLVLRSALKSYGYTSGALGSGFFLGKDENGDAYLEIDRMLVRKVATFVELLIQELRHVGGQIVLSPASMQCSKVEDMGTYYRCYFENTDGDKTINQEFVVNDQARCQTFNIKEGVNENVTNTYYWRLVVGVGDNYIDLSKSDCDAGSTVPQAGDDIVQLGNRTDATRQGAIVLSAYGADSPSIKLYKGINSYQLTGKERISLSPQAVNIIALSYTHKKTPSYKSIASQS